MGRCTREEQAYIVALLQFHCDHGRSSTSLVLVLFKVLLQEKQLLSQRKGSWRERWDNSCPARVCSEWAACAVGGHSAAGFSSPSHASAPARCPLAHAVGTRWQRRRRRQRRQRQPGDSDVNGRRQGGSGVVAAAQRGRRDASVAGVAAGAMVLFYTPRDATYRIYVGRDKEENEELIRYGWETDVWFHVDKVRCWLARCFERRTFFWGQWGWAAEMLLQAKYSGQAHQASRLDASPYTSILLFALVAVGAPRLLFHLLPLVGLPLPSARSAAHPQLSSAHVYLRLPDGGDIASIPSGVLEDCAQLVKHNSIEGNRTNGVMIVYTPWSNLKKSGDMATGQVGFHSPKLVRRTRVEKRDNAIVNRLNKTKTEAFPDLAAEKDTYLRQLARTTREVRLFLWWGGGGWG